jgi:hypothetical protein
VIILGPPDAPPTTLTFPEEVRVTIVGLIEDNGRFPGCKIRQHKHTAC